MGIVLPLVGGAIRFLPGSDASVSDVVEHLGIAESSGDTGLELIRLIVETELMAAVVALAVDAAGRWAQPQPAEAEAIPGPLWKRHEKLAIAFNGEPIPLLSGTVGLWQAYRPSLLSFKGPKFR